jgi:hypothetical protein
MSRRPGVVAGTDLLWTMTVDGPPPDEGLTGHLRFRINHLLRADLRLYGQ